MTFPIRVLLPVRFIMLVIVGHQIPQREPVMSRNEVDAGNRPPPPPTDTNRNCR
jgi:hypothetical protein